MSTEIKEITFHYNKDEKPEKQSYSDLPSFGELPEEIIRTTTEIQFKGRFDGDLFSAFPELERVVWKSRYDTVPEAAFRNCRKLKEVKLPKSVAIIGKYAFFNCQSLEKVEIPGMYNIGDYAFANCKALKHIALPSDLTCIHEGAFQCSGLTEVTIPEETDVYPFAFYRCESLETVTCNRRMQGYALCNGRNMNSIADFSFAECRNLKSVSKNLYRFEERAFIFSGCTDLIRDEYVKTEYRSDFYMEDGELNSYYCSPEVRSVSLSGYFDAVKLPYESGIMYYNDGMMFVNEKEEHIMFQWESNLQYGESFMCEMPAFAENGRKKNLTIRFCEGPDDSSEEYKLYLTFIYTVEHEELEEEVIEHGYICNAHNGYYSHHVYLEKGTYNYEPLTRNPMRFDYGITEKTVRQYAEDWVRKSFRSRNFDTKNYLDEEKETQIFEIIL